MCAKQNMGLAWNKCLQRHMWNPPCENRQVFVEEIGMKEGLEKEVKIFFKKKDGFEKEIKIMWKGEACKKVLRRK